MSENRLPERPYHHQGEHLAKPGKVQAIAIMCLIDGILNILWGIGLACGLALSLYGIICSPVGLYPVVLGILEIIYASQLLADPPRAGRPAQYLAIMQICNILLGDVISVVIGILSLVFYGDYEVKDYFGKIALG